MSRMKILLVSLLAVFAVGSVASASASAAELQGPWWMKLEGGKQVKIEQTKELQVKSDNFTINGPVPFAIISGNKLIECRIVLNKGYLWNGVQAHQGLDEEQIEFFECNLQEAGCPQRPVTLSQAKVRTELMWKYQGIPKELEEQGTQTIHDAIGSSEEITEWSPGRFRARFLTVTVPPGGTCPAASIPLYAEGSLTTWENQQHVRHLVVWGTAPQVEPENFDFKFAILDWDIPNVWRLHHKNVEVQAILQLGNEGAEILGELFLEDEFGQTEFGAWDHT